jgi:hypothetical protein
VPLNDSSATLAYRARRDSFARIVQLEPCPELRFAFVAPEFVPGQGL